MKNATELKTMLEEATERANKFVDSVLAKYEEIFEKDLLAHSRTIIDLTHTLQASIYGVEESDSKVLHPISLGGDANPNIVGKCFESKFKELGYYAYYNGDGVIIVKMK